VQQPCEELRSVAVKCLGLFALSSEVHCRQFESIIFEVANAHRESGLIRGQALEAITDMALIHGSSSGSGVGNMIDVHKLGSLLMRLVDCRASGPLTQVAVQSATKLFFSGSLSDSQLFAHLIRLYFSSDDSSTSDALDSQTAGSDQLLSIFFPAFMKAAGGREAVFLDSVAYLFTNLSDQSWLPMQKVYYINSRKIYFKIHSDLIFAIFCRLLLISFQFARANFCATRSTL
jgi:hypothetical protein